MMPARTEFQAAHEIAANRVVVFHEGCSKIALPCLEYSDRPRFCGISIEHADAGSSILVSRAGVGWAEFAEPIDPGVPVSFAPDGKIVKLKNACVRRFPSPVWIIGTVEEPILKSETEFGGRQIGRVLINPFIFYADSLYQLGKVW